MFFTCVVIYEEGLRCQSHYTVLSSFLISGVTSAMKRLKNLSAYTYGDVNYLKMGNC